MTAATIGYAGLSHLGLCSSVAAAQAGFATLAFAPDAALVGRLQAGAPPISEPGLAEALAANRQRLRFTAAAADLASCDVVYIAVDVPTDDSGASDLSAIGEMIDLVLPQLAPQAILVVLSQVPPGYTRRIDLAPARLFYQVETLIFGRALERASRPERFIIGAAAPAAPLPAAYAGFLAAFGCPILPMRYESAELAKVAINCFLVASVSTTNTLASLCEAIDADWAEIAPALRLDARIGPAAYLSPGLGIAGGNLERDLATVLRLAPEAEVIASYRRNSAHMRDWAFRMLERTVLGTTPRPRLGILGLAYKQDTDSTRNSASLALIARLGGAEITAHDPVIPRDAVSRIARVAAPVDVADAADAVLVMTPWPQYRDLAPAALAARMRGRTLIDPYRMLDAAAVAKAGLDLYSIGRKPLPASEGPGDS